MIPDVTVQLPDGSPPVPGIDGQDRLPQMPRDRTVPNLQGTAQLGQADTPLLQCRFVQLSH